MNPTFPNPTTWPPKAKKWFETRNVFDIESTKFDLGSAWETIHASYTINNPRVPKLINKYQNRLVFDWGDWGENMYRQPFKKNGPRWIAFYNNGDIVIEWKLPKGGSGIKLVSLFQDTVYFVNGKETSCPKQYQKHCLFVHLENYEILSTPQLIDQWLYNEPLIGDPEE